MNKTVPQEDTEKYLRGDYKDIRGFISTNEHSKSLKTLENVYEGN